jgi:hypothetical protein
MTFPYEAPTWRCFENINSRSEAATLASSCVYSLATLEAASVPDSVRYALTERKDPKVWRWAIIGECGFLVEEGFAPSQDDAKRAAEGALFVGRPAPARALAI